MVIKSKMEQLYQSGRSVFTIDDLRVLWQEDSPDNLKSKAAYYVERGKLKRLRRGVYALDPYNEFELANKLIVPSYLSLETALLKHGIIFQPASAITSIASYDKKIIVEKRSFHFYKMATDILSNPKGLQREGEVLIAGPERAICDSLYLKGPAEFANLGGIDEHKLRDVASIYADDRVKDLIVNLIKQIKS
jgi:predicted transcriptional regulator of viral defense system